MASDTGRRDVETLAAAAEATYGPLAPLLADELDRPIADRFGWEDHRQRLLAKLLDWLGAFPATLPPLAPEVGDDHREDGYRRRRVTYASESDDRVPAWLLIPNGEGPFPGILALHPTYPGGKDIAVGLEGNENRHYGKELAQRGYVVLAPDTITAGERLESGWEPYVTRPWDEAHPDWSAMGKMIWDHQRACDYLTSLPFVDSARIGAIGHSLGAYNAFLLAAYDDRIRAVVESCGYTTMAADPKIERWARDSWFVHIPKLRPVVKGELPVPFEWHEVIALLAPRPLFQYAGLDDSIFPNTDSLAQVHQALRPVYELYGETVDEQVVTWLEPGPHDFPPAVRQAAYAFLDHWLK